MLLLKRKSWCRDCSGAGSPEDLRGKLPPLLTTGMLGSEGLLTRFLKAVPVVSLRALLTLAEMEAAPLTGGGPKAAETRKDLVSGEC